MSKLSKVKGYYDSGLWTVAMVANAVSKDWITAAEYLEITGDTYTAPETRLKTLQKRPENNKYYSLQL